MDKPRIAQVLGVEVGEVWTFGGDPTKFRINRDGHREYYHCDKWLDGCAEFNLCDAINHPDLIIRKPRFTEQEVERARAIRLLFPDAVAIERLGNIIIAERMDRSAACVISADLMPVIQNRDHYTLDEIIGGAE